MQNWVDSVDQSWKLLPVRLLLGHRIGRAWGFKTKMPLPGSVIPVPHGQAAVEDSTVVEAPPVDFYELLGVDPDATTPDIKAAYRSLPYRNTGGAVI